ncbi:hypothetical protein [Rathayibacter sp. VKM Ac-2927]|uniref:hypothetical protein n=1 Tax=Rathayibacter sp. VKM Ac-2927 TaxID=2929478 RepID=UPI001FB2AF16|nr:hypothetical protein [Rathayibacter sp. VKM Ac-2927]MCJ1688451.1 hypothetical protein [Rathayibacter sp. VKM Ac-2927]
MITLRKPATPSSSAPSRLSLIVLTAALTLGAVVAPTASAQAAPRIVVVSGDITTDTIWSRADADVYLVDSRPTVAADAQLTITEGVVVKFMPYAGLEVEGSLVSAGTADAPVVLTAASDDTVGPAIDTASAPPRSDYWNGIGTGFGGISLALDHTDIRYAGIDAVSELRLTNSSVTGTTVGVIARGHGDATVTDSSIDGDLQIHRFGWQQPAAPTSATITGNTLTGGRLEVSAAYSGPFTVRNNTVIGATFDPEEPLGLQPAIALSAPNLHPRDFATNTATDGDRDYIALEGSLAESWTVPTRGLRYEIGGLGLTDTAGLTVPRGVTLTLPASAALTVRPDWRGPAFTIDGRLVAAATPSRPATITFAGDTGPASTIITVRGSGAAAAYGLSLVGIPIANTAGTFGTAKPTCAYLVTASQAAQRCR